jgi:hypothetical protein
MITSKSLTEHFAIPWLKDVQRLHGVRKKHLVRQRKQPHPTVKIVWQSSHSIQIVHHLSPEQTTAQQTPAEQTPTPTPTNYRANKLPYAEIRAGSVNEDSFVILSRQFHEVSFVNAGKTGCHGRTWFSNSQQTSDLPFSLV